MPAGAFAERLIANLQPWMTEDLEAYCEALGAMFDPVLELAEEEGEQDQPGWVPPWGKLLDPALVPGKDLAFLGQFVGVAVPQGMPEIEARSLVKEEPGLERGTLQAVEKAITRVLGAEPFLLLERTDLLGGEDGYFFLIVVPFHGSNLVADPSFEYRPNGSTSAWWEDELPAVEVFEINEGWAQVGKKSLEIKAKLTSTGHGSLLHEIIGLEAETTYHLIYTYNAIELNGAKVRTNIEWLNNKAEVISSVVVEHESLGVKNISETLKSPAGTVAAQIFIGLKNTVATHSVHVYFDAISFGTTQIYTDGDQPGWQWTGTPGLSTSIYDRRVLRQEVNLVKPGGVLYEVVEVEPVVWLEATKTWEEVEESVTWENVSEGDV